MDAIRGYLTARITESLSAFVEDLTLEELGIGGDIVLEQLRLRRNVLQKALNLPFDLEVARGTVKSLRLSIPWARIVAQARPIVQVTLESVEIVIRKTDGTSFIRQSHSSSSDMAINEREPPVCPEESAVEDEGDEEVLSSARPATQAQGRQSSWLMDLSRKLLLNITLKVQNLSLLYDDMGIVASAHACSIHVYSANPCASWDPSFNWVHSPASPWLFKAIALTDVTLCLDERPTFAVADGAPPSVSLPQSTGRQHERPVLDRASITAKLAVDVRGLLGIVEQPSEPPSSTLPRHIVAIEGAFLDSPYGMSPYLTSQGGATQESVHRSCLPKVFTRLCPILTAGRRRVWRPSRAVSLWDNSEEVWQTGANEDKGSPADPTEPPLQGMRAAAIVAVECEDLRLSLSQRQASCLALLSRKLQVMTHRGTRKADPRKADVAASNTSGEEGPAEGSAKLRVLSFYVKSLELSIFKDRAANVEEASIRQRSLLFSMQARHLWIEEQRLLRDNKIALTDIKASLSALKVLHFESSTIATEVLQVEHASEDRCPQAHSTLQLLAALYQHTVMAQAGNVHPPSSQVEENGFALAAALLLRAFKYVDRDGSRRYQASAVTLPSRLSISLPLVSLSDIDHLVSACSEPWRMVMATDATALEEVGLSFSTSAKAQQCFILHFETAALQASLKMKESSSLSPLVRWSDAFYHQADADDTGRIKSLEVSLLSVAISEAAGREVEVIHIPRLTHAVARAPTPTHADSPATNPVIQRETLVLSQGGSVSALPSRLSLLTATYTLFHADLISLLQVWSSSRIKNAIIAFKASHTRQPSALPAACISLACAGLRVELRQYIGSEETMYMLIDQVSIRLKEGSYTDTRGPSLLLDTRDDRLLIGVPQLVIQQSTIPSLRELKVRAPRRLDLIAGPLELRALRSGLVSLFTAVQSVATLGASAAKSEANGVLRQEIRLELASVRAVLQLPWLRHEVPEIVLLAHQAVYGSSISHRNLRIGELRAEGAVLAKGTPATAFCQIRLISARIAPFCDTRTLVALQAALTGGSPSNWTDKSVEKVTVPLLLPYGDATPSAPALDLTWCLHPVAGKVFGIQIALGSFDLQCYFPIFHCLERLYSAAMRPAPSHRKEHKRKANEKENGENRLPALDIQCRPFRIMLLAGPMREASFAMRINVRDLLTLRREGHDRGAWVLKQASLQPELGQWALREVQTIELRKAWWLAEEIKISSESEPSQTTPITLHMSPIDLCLGQVELAILRAAVRLVSSNLMHASSQADIETEMGTAEAVSAAASRLRAICPSLQLTFRMPRTGAFANDALFFKIGFVSCQLAVWEHHVSIEADTIRLTDLRKDVVSMRLNSDHLNSDKEKAALSALCRRSQNGLISSLTVQLTPICLSLDPTAISLLSKLAGFVHLSLDDLSDQSARAMPVNPSRNCRPVAQRGTVETFEFMTSGLKLQLMTPMTGSDVHLQWDVPRLGLNYTSTLAGTEMRLNMVDMTVALGDTSLENDQKCDTWPVIDRASIFVSVENLPPRPLLCKSPRGFIVGDDRLAVPPSAATVTIDPCVMRISPCTLHALNTFARSCTFRTLLTAAPPSQRTASTVPGNDCALAEVQTFCQPLCHLKLRIDDDVNTRPIPGELVSQRIPRIRGTSLASAAESKPGVQDLGENLPQRQQVRGTDATASLASVPALSWTFPQNVRVAFVSCPVPLPLHISGIGDEVYAVPSDIVMELSTQSEGIGEVVRRSSVARFPLTLHLGEDVDNLEPSRFAAESSKVGRTWHLELHWRTCKPLVWSLEKLWRPLLLSLTKHLSFEVFSPTEDQVRAVAHIYLPQAELQLCAQENLEGEAQAVATGRRAKALALVSIGELTSMTCLKKRGGNIEAFGQCRKAEIRLCDYLRRLSLPFVRADGLRCRMETDQVTYTTRASNSGSVTHCVGARSNVPSVAVGIAEGQLSLSAQAVQVLDVLKTAFVRSGQGQIAAAEAAGCVAINLTQEPLWCNEPASEEILHLAGPAAHKQSPAVLVRFKNCHRPSLRIAIARQRDYEPAFEAKASSTASTQPRPCWSTSIALASDVTQELRLPDGTGYRSLWVVVQQHGLQIQVLLLGAVTVKNMLPFAITCRLALAPKLFKSKAGHVQWSLPVQVPAGPPGFVDRTADNGSLGFSTRDGHISSTVIMPDSSQREPGIKLLLQISPQDIFCICKETFGETLEMELPEQAEVKLGKQAGVADSCTNQGSAIVGGRCNHITGIPAWFICNLRPLWRFQTCHVGAATGRYVVEVWPIAYIMSSDIPLQIRVIPCVPSIRSDSVVRLRSSSIDSGQARSQSWYPTRSASQAGFGRFEPHCSATDVESAKRAIREKSGRLALRRLQGSLTPEVNAASCDGEFCESMSTDSSPASSLDGSTYRVPAIELGTGPAEAQALCQADPCGGSILRLLHTDPTTKLIVPTADFMLPCHILFGRSRSEAGQHDCDTRVPRLLNLVDDPQSESPRRDVVAYAVQDPASLCPALLIEIAPRLSIANYLPFPVMLMALTAQEGRRGVHSDSGIDAISSCQGTEGDPFLCSSSSNVKQVPPGQAMAAGAWACLFGDRSMLVALGITVLSHPASGQVYMQELPMDHLHHRQSWSPAFCLADLVEAAREHNIAELVITVPVCDLWLPVCIRCVVESNPMEEQACGRKHTWVCRLEIRPRITIHSTVRKPPNSKLGIVYRTKALMTFMLLDNDSMEQVVLLAKVQSPTPSMAYTRQCPDVEDLSHPSNNRCSTTINRDHSLASRLWQSIAGTSPRSQQDQTVCEVDFELQLIHSDSDARPRQGERALDDRLDHTIHLTTMGGNLQQVCCNCSTGGPMIRGVNDVDVLAAQLSLSYKDGTHALCARVEPDVSLLVINSCQHVVSLAVSPNTDKCISKARESSEKEVDTGFDVVHIPSTAKVECMVPAREGVSLRSVAQSTDCSSSRKLRDRAVSLSSSVTFPQGQRDPDDSGSSEQVGSTVGYRRNTFARRKACPYSFRICYHGRQTSAWSAVRNTSKLYSQEHRLTVHFPDSTLNPSIELVLRWTATAGFWCVQIGELQPLLLYRSLKDMDRPNRASAAASSLDCSIDVAIVYIRLLGDGVSDTSEGNPRVRSLLSARLLGLRCRYCSIELPGELLRNYRVVEVGLLDFQVDHHSENAEFTVVFSLVAPDVASAGRTLDFRFTEAVLDQEIFGFSRAQTFVENLSLDCPHMRLSFDEALLQNVLHLARKWSDSSQPMLLQRQHCVPLHICCHQHSAQKSRDWVQARHCCSSIPRLFFRSVRLSAVSLTLDTRLFIPGSGIYVGLDASPLSFEETNLEAVYVAPASFLRGVLANFLADAIFQSPTALGSLEILGSPAILLSRVLQGLRDLIVLSATGASDGPLATLSGAGRGLWSLTKHVIGGTLSSLAGISSNVRYNINGQGPQQLHRKPASSPENSRCTSQDPPASRLARGKDAQLTRAPNNRLGADLGRGLVRAVTVPISGTMAAVWWTSDRLINATGVNRNMADRREPLAIELHVPCYAIDED